MHQDYDKETLALLAECVLLPYCNDKKKVWVTMEGFHLRDDHREIYRMISYKDLSYIDFKRGLRVEVKCSFPEALQRLYSAKISEELPLRNRIPPKMSPSGQNKEEMDQIKSDWKTLKAGD